MADEHLDDYFPEEAEENEIGGPVFTAICAVALIVLIIWAMT